MSVPDKVAEAAALTAAARDKLAEAVPSTDAWARHALMQMQGELDTITRRLGNATRVLGAGRRAG